MHVLERDIQKTIIDYLELKGHLVVKAPTAGIRKADGSYIPLRQKGISDLLVCRKGDGKFVGVEVKTPTGKLSPEQFAFQKQLILTGGEAITARSIEDLQRAGL